MISLLISSWCISLYWVLNRDMRVGLVIIEFSAYPRRLKKSKISSLEGAILINDNLSIIYKTELIDLICFLRLVFVSMLNDKDLSLSPWGCVSTPALPWSLLGRFLLNSSLKEHIFWTSPHSVHLFLALLSSKYCFQPAAFYITIQLLIFVFHFHQLLSKFSQVILGFQ